MKQRLIWTTFGAVLGVFALIASVFFVPTEDVEAACKPGDAAPCPGADGAPILGSAPGQFQLLARTGAATKLHLALTYANGTELGAYPLGLSTVVQLQDNAGAWIDVAGWRKVLPDGGGGIDYFPEAAYFGQGPARWEVRDVRNGNVVITTLPFMIPRSGEQFAVGYKIGFMAPAGSTATPIPAVATAIPAVATAIPSVSTPVPPATALQVVVNVRYLNMRALPNTYSRALTVLPAGLVLNVVGISPNRQWYQVRVGHLTGWVYIPLTRAR